MIAETKPILLDDLVMPFRIEDRNVRGRLVRLGPLVQRVLDQHKYPEPVSRLLAEVLALTAMLGSNLKHDGLLTVQGTGDGLVDLFVSDYKTPGDMRGYARYKEAGLKKVAKPDFGALMGTGQFAITLDPKGSEERYQGIVELNGDSLAACAEAYFRQSEQIPTAMNLGAAHIGGQWRAGGIIVQHLPGEDVDSDEEQEHWRRARIMTRSAERSELTDPALSAERLLYRLFHEDGVRVFNAIPLRFRCRCSEDRVRKVLSSLTQAERNDSEQDGIISVTCEFCSTVYEFTADEFERRKRA